MFRAWKDPSGGDIEKALGKGDRMSIFPSIDPVSIYPLWLYLEHNATEQDRQVPALKQLIVE